jgi:hypothetical protein
VHGSKRLLVAALPSVVKGFPFFWGFAVALVIECDGFVWLTMLAQVFAGLEPQFGTIKYICKSQNFSTQIFKLSKLSPQPDFCSKLSLKDRLIAALVL